MGFLCRCRNSSRREFLLGARLISSTHFSSQATQPVEPNSPALAKTQRVTSSVKSRHVLLLLGVGEDLDRGAIASSGGVGF
jgi:hypothetical protein